MTSPSEQLAAAKAAQEKNRPYRDVTVLLDAGLAEKRDRLREQLDAAKAEVAQDQRLAAEDPPAVVELKEQLDAILAESKASLQTVRFLKATPTFWADVTARCPVRLGSPVDQHYGYNMTLATQLVAQKCAGWLIDGERVPFVKTAATVDGEGNTVPAVDEWADLIETISGGEFAEMESAVFDLNVYGPSVARQALLNELATHPA